MNRPIIHTAWIAPLALAVTTGSACAGITTFWNTKVAWFNAVGGAQKIDFVGNEEAQIIGFDWYIDYGITLGSFAHPEAASWVLHQSPATLDGWGANPATGLLFDEQVINFLTPQHAFAYDEWTNWGEDVTLKFYFQWQLIAAANCPATQFFESQVNFHGWVTDFAFDRVEFNNSDIVDAIYVVPSPGGLAVLAAIVGLCTGRRRAG